MDSERFNELNRTFERVKDESNNFTLQIRGNRVFVFAGVLDGNFSIAITAQNESELFKSTGLIKISNRLIKGKIATVFSLTDSDLINIFISFALDIESIIKRDNDATLTEIHNRYIYWQKMFKVTASSISEDVIKGLMNELNILKNNLIPKYGVKKAVSGWTGSEGTIKDFAYDDCWYEAKAINKGKKVVEISSLGQLESLTDGQLLISEFEKTAPENINGVTLFDLLNEIKKELDQENDIEEFINKIAQLGIDEDVFSDKEHEVNGYRYIIHGVTGYRINEYFPKLTVKNVPKSIGKVRYELILPEIEEYKENFH